MVKRFLVIAAVCALVCGVSVAYAGNWAKGKGSCGADNVDRKVSKWTKALKLDQQQQEQLRAILTQCNNDTQKLKEEMRAKMQQIHSAKHEQIKAILTPQQQAQFEKMGERKKEKCKDKDSDD